MNTKKGQEANKNPLQILKMAYNRNGMLLILIIMIMLISIITPNFLKIQNIINIVRQISFITIIGCGTIFVLISGNIDLSSGAVASLTSVVAASFAHPGEYPLIVTILIGISVGALCGLVNGILVANFKIPSFIVTLGLSQAANGIALILSNACPIPNLSDEFVFLGIGKFLGIPFPVIILAIVLLISWTLLNKTRYGRHVCALGGNEQAAIISGINVKKTKISTFVIAGVMASIAGIALTARVSSGQPALGTGMELDAIAATVIGGTSLLGGVGSISGTMIGGLIIGVINNGMDLTNINMFYQQITKGTIMVGAVILDSLKAGKSFGKKK